MSILWGQLVNSWPVSRQCGQDLVSYMKPRMLTPATAKLTSAEK